MDNPASDGAMGFATEVSSGDRSIAWFGHDAVPPPSHRRHPGAAGDSPAPRGTGLSADALRRVQVFIDGHIGEAFTLEQLAHAVCISRFHFARMFRQTLRQSPMQYVLSLRIDVAKQMLRTESDKTIAAIASELGFCDQSHFTRSFHRLTGMTPGRFARQLAVDASKQGHRPGPGGTPHHGVSEAGK